jgi:hypothetical protein
VSKRRGIAEPLFLARHIEKAGTGTLKRYKAADPGRSVVFPALSSKRRSHHLAIIAAGCLIIGVGVLLAQLKS